MRCFEAGQAQMVPGPQGQGVVMQQVAEVPCNDSLWTVIGVGTGLKLGLLLLVAFGGFAFLLWATRRLDRSNGLEFKLAYDEIKGGNQALGSYHAARFLGLCLIVAAGVLAVL